MYLYGEMRAIDILYESRVLIIPAPNDDVIEAILEAVQSQGGWQGDVYVTTSHGLKHHKLPIPDGAPVVLIISKVIRGVHLYVVTWNMDKYNMDGRHSN